MNELKPLPCPICGDELKIHGPEDWHPTPYDPDSGGAPYNAACDCGFSFLTGTYDYAEFVAALNRRAQPANDPLTLEQLREMDGEPVWVDTMREWRIVCIGVEKDVRLYSIRNTISAKHVFNNDGRIYRRKPERSEDNGKL